MAESVNRAGEGWQSTDPGEQESRAWAAEEVDRLRAELEQAEQWQADLARRAERAEAERDEAKALHGEDVAVIFDRAWRAARMTRERAERAEAEVERLLDIVSTAQRLTSEQAVSQVLDRA